MKTLTITPGKKVVWFGVTFLTALCSMIYELILAQTLSSVMGNTAFRYSMTIGLYIAAMGLGAIFVDKFSKKLSDLHYFVQVELYLAILGAVAPWVVLMVDSGLQSLSAQGTINYFASGPQLISNLINHGIIVVIGFLAGLELPLLMRIGRTQNIDSSFKVLSMDYVGTTCGAILFPLVLFPNLNLFTMAYVFSLINTIVALQVARKFNSRGSYKIMAFIWALFLIFLISHSDHLNQALVNYFYVRGTP
jgi:spermidine synthase